MNVSTLVLLLEKRPDVITRISGLCWRRGFNILSVTVGDAEVPSVARMTLVCSTTGAGSERMTKQLDKLINVLKVSELPRHECIDRELALIKVSAGARMRAEILDIVGIIGGSIVDVTSDSVIVQVSGAPDGISGVTELVRPYGITEIVRTGCIALRSGSSKVTVPPPRHAPNPPLTSGSYR